MASASKTPNLNLPQWVGTEKPERTDFNTAFDAIDTLAGLIRDVQNIADWDNIDYEGLSIVRGTTGADNAPDVGTILGIQIKIGGEILQIATRINTATNNFYVRRANSGQWFAWTNII